METKICCRCKQEKPVSEFHKKKDKYQWICKECRKKYHRQHYLANKEKYLINAKEYKQEVKERFNKIKQELSCEICGESCLCCLDFHHKDPTQKELNLAQAVNIGWSIERIKKEIAKCTVLCANCHRKVHAGVVQLVGQ